MILFTVDAVCLDTRLQSQASGFALILAAWASFLFFIFTSVSHSRQASKLEKCHTKGMVDRIFTEVEMTAIAVRVSGQLAKKQRKPMHTSCTWLQYPNHKNSQDVQRGNSSACPV